MSMFVHLLTAILVHSWSGSFANAAENRLHRIDNFGWLGSFHFLKIETEPTFGLSHTSTVRIMLSTLCFSLLALSWLLLTAMLIVFTRVLASSQCHGITKVNSLSVHCQMEVSTSGMWNVHRSQPAAWSHIVSSLVYATLWASKLCRRVFAITLWSSVDRFSIFKDVALSHIWGNLQQSKSLNITLKKFLLNITLNIAATHLRC